MSKGFLITILLIGILFLAMFYFGQARMIYFPRGYHPRSELFDLVTPVRYVSGECRQTAFLYPVRNGEELAPGSVWWFFGGNGSTAMEWIAFLESDSYPDDRVFVLVDYPGYGLCRGKPRPDSIRASVATLHAHLADRWGLPPDELSRRSRTLGHSLGAAVALATAAEYEMPEVVAISPFTSMSDMARRQVGPLSVLLRHHFDNRDAIRKLVAGPQDARIHLFHGNADTLIPHEMSEELLALAGPERASLKTAARAGHNNVLGFIGGELLQILAREGK